MYILKQNKKRSARFCADISMIFQYLDPVEDPLDVHLRIRDFVPSWRLFFNKRKHRYEVHDIKSGEWHTLVSVLPFDQIDARTVEYLATHNVRSFGKIIRQIEENNADIVRKKMYEASRGLESALRNQTK